MQAQFERFIDEQFVEPSVFAQDERMSPEEREKFRRAMAEGYGIGASGTAS
jgi:hypothetical protein